jgi:hypothetical protein
VCGRAFRRLFVRQLEETETFARQIEGAVNPPQLVFRLGQRPGLGNRGGVDEANQPALSGLGRIKRQRLTNEQGEPIAALP